jgi:hypothetical protein
LAYQPSATVLFSQNKPAASNQPTVLFSQNKSAPPISHQPNEHAGGTEGTKPPASFSPQNKKNHPSVTSLTELSVWGK